MIRFPCGTCGKRLRVPARLAGKRGRCEVCGAINRVPLADVPSPPVAAEQRNHARPSAGAPRGAAAAHPEAQNDPKNAAVVHPVRESPAKSSTSRPAPPRRPPAATAHARTAEAESPPPAAAPAPVRESIPEPLPAPVEETASDPEPVVVSEDVPTATVAVPMEERHPVVEAVAETIEDPAPPPAESPPPADDGLPVVVAPAPPPPPPVLAVDVRRAEGPSPFRSTADITPRETIEGTVALPNAQFAAEGRPIAVVDGADANQTVKNFLDLVQRRTAVVDPTDSGHAAEPEEPALRILHVDVDVIDDAIDAAVVATPPMSPTWRPLHAEPAQHATRERAGVIVALIVGLILGFCLGLLASEWL
jgi:hypothetical protein